MKLNAKKFTMAAIVSVVLAITMEFALHSLILGETYREPQYATLWNPLNIMQARQPFMFLAHLLFGFTFTLIYTQGYEPSKSAVGQGLRYGLLIGLLAPVHGSLVEYFVYPVSGGLAVAWSMGGVIESMILGTVVALIYRPKS